MLPGSSQQERHQFVDELDSTAYSASNGSEVCNSVYKHADKISLLLLLLLAQAYEAQLS